MNIPSDNYTKPINTKTAFNYNNLNWLQMNNLHKKSIYKEEQSPITNN